MDRADGYVQELGYTHGYCSEIAPGLLELACISRGISPPGEGGPLLYLELAFGQGVSFNIHAAASPGEYWGIDLNPGHAANARALADASGSRATILADSFAEFAAREAVPQFDVIALHAAWSWISAENRNRVVEIVRRRLAPGGVFCMTYNSLPGWAPQMPLRHLLAQHAAVSGAGSGLAAKIDASMDFAQAMIDTGTGYFAANPGLEAWLGDMRGRSRNYLAHEYFNRDWHPMAFSEVASALSAAGLGFVCSATLGEHVEGAGLPQAARALLGGVTDPILRETALDYFVNRRLRRDIFAAAPNALDGTERERRLRACPFVLLQQPDQVAPESGDYHRPVAEALAGNGFAPKTLGQLESHPACRTIGFDALVRAMLTLVSAGSAHPARTPAEIDAAAPQCARLNERLLERAAAGDPIAALASPVTGAGLFVAREELAFLHAIALGHAGEDAWAKYAWETLGEGDPAGLRSAARAFARIRLPVLKALRVA